MLAAGKKNPRSLAGLTRANESFSMNKNIADSSCLDNVSDTVTVLKVGSRKSATKTFRWDGTAFLKTRDFDAGMWFSHQEHAASNIHDLSRLLTAVEAAQDSFIIRGRLNAQAPSKERVRRMKNPVDNGDIWFTEHSRRWVLIDIDDVDLPRWADPVTDPERIAKFLINQMPDCFYGVTCHWQMSSSAGIKPATEARAHLWFWLDRPLGQEELKRWRTDFGIRVDPLVFGTVQPLYVARPIFVGGLDPLPRRSGLLTGDSDVVAVPEIDMTVATRTRPTSSTRHHSTGMQHDFDAAPGFENKLALLGDGGGLEGFHYPITAAIASYISEHGDDCDAEALKVVLRKRIDKAPKNLGRDGDIEQYKSDAYLDTSIHGAISKFGAPKKVPALYQAPSGGLSKARGKLGKALKIWRGAAIRHARMMNRREARLRKAELTSQRQRSTWALFDPEPPPPVHGIDAGTGIGKSREMRGTVRDLIPHLSPGHCVFVAVPNHRLSEEMADAFAALDVTAAVYRGLSADDPDAPGDQMCRIAFDAEALRRGGGKLDRLCEGCPHAGDCGWQRQLGVEAQVWIGAHNLLFHPRRDPIPTIDFVVVDESPIAAGLKGFSDTDALSMSAAELRHRAGNGERELSLLRNNLADAIESSPADALLMPGNFPVLTGTDVRDAPNDVYGEMEEIHADGKMSGKERQAEIEIAKRNHRRLVEVAIWGKLGHVNEDKPTPGLRIEEQPNADGIPEPRLRLRRRRLVHSDFRKPTLLLDATPQWDAYRKFWDINRTTKIEAAMPHVTVRQIIWSASGAKLLKDTETSNSNCGRVARYIESRAAGFQRVLVLCQMGLEERLRERMPENVQISHFNAVRGLDRWKDVDCLIMIGRTQPPPKEVEMQAEVIFDEVPNGLDGAYYPKKDAGLTITENAKGNCVQMEYHPDNNSEVMRWLACEAELIQCVGRARGVNRTADTALQIDIVGTVPLPFMVNEVMKLDEANPDPLDVMAGRGVVLDCDPSAKGAAKVIAAMLPDLYGTSDAVKSARRRSRCQTPNKSSLLGKRHREENLKKRWRTTRLKLPDSRYSVPIKVRRCLWRGLRDDETPPQGARLSKLWKVIFVLEPLLPEEFRANAGYILRNQEVEKRVKRRPLRHQ
jgi:hypothetical protein